MRVGGHLFRLVTRLVQDPATAAAEAGNAGPRSSMSLIRWQPHSGFACLSMRIVRLVSSCTRLPLGPPRA